MVVERGKGREKEGSHTLHSIKLLQSSRTLKIPRVTPYIAAVVCDFRVDFGVCHARSHRTVCELH
jgi:hypothetical protein